jgi:hypothetical protein
MSAGAGRKTLIGEIGCRDGSEMFRMAGVRAEMHSGSGTAGGDAADRWAANAPAPTGDSSSTTWTFVPLNPIDMTPACRRFPAFTGQGVSTVGI